MVSGNVRLSCQAEAEARVTWGLAQKLIKGLKEKRSLSVSENCDSKFYRASFS